MKKISVIFIEFIKDFLFVYYVYFLIGRNSNKNYIIGDKSINVWGNEDVLCIWKINN